MIERKETFKLASQKNDETEAILEKQNEELDLMKTTIKTKQSEVDGKLKEVEEKRKVNLYEEEKNRKYAKANAALKAKLEFIETKYDYTSAVKNLSPQDFSDLISSHVAVNSTMDGFKDKLGLMK